MIVPNGYNIGRDWLVDRATSVSRWKSMWWRADLEWREGLLKPGKEGSSDLVLCVKERLFILSSLFFCDLGVNHGIEQDGRVAILTVRRL